MFRTESSSSNTIAVHDFRFDLLIKKMEFRDYAMNHGSWPMWSSRFHGFL